MQVECELGEPPLASTSRSTRYPSFLRPASAFQRAMSPAEAQEAQRR